MGRRPVSREVLPEGPIERVSYLIDRTEASYDRAQRGRNRLDAELYSAVRLNLAQERVTLSQLPPSVSVLEALTMHYEFSFKRLDIVLGPVRQ